MSGQPPQPLPWSSALVTGSSSGIGRALATELARRGVARLVLVARREETLASVAGELSSTWGTTVEVVPADLVEHSERARVEERLRSADEPIDLLVNNAGVGFAGPFHRADPEREAQQIELNVTAPVHLCRAALPGMVERGRGAILNVSSMAANQPSPGMATYSATKAFVTLFSESLYEELRGTGVTTTAVLPGYTTTEFQANFEDNNYDDAPSFMWMTAEAVAAEAVKATAAGKALCIPGAIYKTANVLEAPLPRSARRWLIGRMSGFSRDD